MIRTRETALVLPVRLHPWGNPQTGPRDFKHITVIKIGGPATCLPEPQKCNSPKVAKRFSGHSIPSMVKIVSPEPPVVTVAAVKYVVKIGGTLNDKFRPQAWYVVAFNLTGTQGHVPLGGPYQSREAAA